MNYGKEILRAITEARQGNHASLELLRQMMGPDPSTADQHNFEVTSNRVLIDTVKTGPRIRSEVFPKIPRFADEFIKPSLWSSWFPIKSISRCPPLAKVFWYEAQSVIGLLETRLITDDSLTRAGRSDIHRQLKALMSDQQPCWISWIKGTPARKLDQFDVIVDRWLREPIDWSEQEWFAPGWNERLYDLESATHFFKKLPRELHWFFGIEMSQAVVPDTDKEFECAFLNKSIEEANQFAELMGVKFRFRPSQDTPPKARRSMRSK